jgi:light-regulated signal transduction histidine kinase (bacteriophytochrome)
MNRKKSGQSYWESTHISPLIDEQGQITHFIAIKEDVTQRKQAEARIAQLNIDLERRVAERTRELRLANKELETFSYSVAHDLRAPLRGISGFSTLMATETCKACGNEQALEFLRRIQRASVRMGDLVDDLLELSSTARRKVKAQTVDLSGMAREVLAELAARHPGREVAVAVEEGIRLNGDAGLLRILLENLLGNAWKFTSRQEQAAISLGAKEHNGERVVFVKDNGVGFDMACADRLFLPFQRLVGAAEYEGSGIGLAIAQRIVGLHGGRIWAEGQAGGGAAFHFVIPHIPLPLTP